MPESPSANPDGWRTLGGEGYFPYDRKLGCVSLFDSEKDYRACNGAIVAAGRLLELAGRLNGELTPGNASGIHLTQVKVTNVYTGGKDDEELAALIAEATNNFDPARIEELKALVGHERDTLDVNPSKLLPSA